MMKKLYSKITALMIVMMVLQPLLLPALPAQAQDVSPEDTAQAAPQVWDELELDPDVIVAANTGPRVIEVGHDGVPTMEVVTDGTAHTGEFITIYVPLKVLNQLKADGFVKQWFWIKTIEDAKGKWSAGHAVVEKDFTIDVNSPQMMWKSAGQVREPDAVMWHHISNPVPDSIQFEVLNGEVVIVFSLHHQQVKYEGNWYDRFFSGFMNIAGQIIMLLDHARTPYGATVYGESDPAPADGMYQFETYDSVFLWFSRFTPPDEPVFECISFDVSQNRDTPPVEASGTYTATSSGFANWGDGSAEVPVYPGQTLTHTFDVSGTYTVTAYTLALGGDHITNDNCIGVVVVKEEPEEPVYGCIGLTVSQDREVAPVKVTATYTATGDGVVNGLFVDDIPVVPGQTLTNTITAAGVYTFTAYTITPNGIITSPACQGVVTIKEKPEEPKAECVILNHEEIYTPDGLQVTTTAWVSALNPFEDKAKIDFAGAIFEVKPEQRFSWTFTSPETYTMTGWVQNFDGTYVTSDACKYSVTLEELPEEPEPVCVAGNFVMLPGELISFFNGANSVARPYVEHLPDDMPVSLVSSRGEIFTMNAEGDIPFFQKPRSKYTVKIGDVLSDNPACSSEINGVFMNWIENIKEQAACLRYTASIPAGTPLRPDETVDLSYNVTGTVTVTLGSLVATPIDGWVHFFDVDIEPGQEVKPTLTRADGFELPADNCAVMYKSVPTGTPKEINISRSDPEWQKVHPNQLGNLLINWVNGFVTSTIPIENMGTYSIDIQGGDEAYASGWMNPMEKVIFGFKKLAYVIHHNFSWVDTNGTGVSVSQLASIRAREYNPNALEITLSNHGEIQTLTWSEDQVGVPHYLPNGLMAMFGIYTDARNNHRPSVMLTNGCMAIIAAREHLQPGLVPSSPVITVVVYPGCEDYTSQLTGGYLMNLLQGGDTMGNPNDYRETGLGIGATVASAANESTEIIFSKNE